MFCKDYLRGGLGRPGVLAALLTVVAATTAVSPVQAEINDTNWSLRISEREMAFRPATDMMAMKSLMWDLPYSRMFARNMPYICLTNDSATASITQFKMTIGDEKFHFADEYMGDFATLGKESPTKLELSSTTENNDNTLIVNFLGSGLLPGQSVNFKFDIDVDSQYAGSIYMHPDYRTVLFDMNGDNLYNIAGIDHIVSSSDNAKVSLKFEMAGMTPVTVGPVPFEDPSVVDGSAGFVNTQLARYGQNDPIRAFNLSGGSVTIPEPGSVALAAALVGIALPAVRVRRKRQPIARTQAA